MTSESRPAASSVSVQMSAQKTADTAPEVTLRSALHSRGWRYNVQKRVLGDVRRTHDIVFTRRRVVVDVHGCFWHGCAEHFVEPKSNTAFWAEKIERNRRRDADTAERLGAAGWTYLIVWEHEDTAEAADRVESALKSADR